MKTRDQIIVQILRERETVCGGPDAYTPVVRRELEKRLTESRYLTCESDFDHFDANCCESCHWEAHYQLSDVTLDDGRHAFVCCVVRDILLRRTRFLGCEDLDNETAVDLFREISGANGDPIEEQLHIGNLRASSDEEKLCYCLKYAHHVSGRKRGRKRVETLVKLALRLPGGAPAKTYRDSQPPRSRGYCLRCGCLIYDENMIPGTFSHNCRASRELHSPCSGNA